MFTVLNLKQFKGDHILLRHTLPSCPCSGTRGWLWAWAVSAPMHCGMLRHALPRPGSTGLQTSFKKFYEVGCLEVLNFVTHLVCLKTLKD